MTIMTFFKKHLLILPFVALCSLLFCNCESGDDDYRYPSVRTDFVCLTTDDAGRFERMLLDNGECYPTSIADGYMEQSPIYKADTTYRLIGVYELATAEQGGTEAKLYSIGNVLSVAPTPLKEGEELAQDPVHLQSAWISGNYLNVVVEIKALNGKHSIDFVDTTPETMDGKEFTLYHKVIDDVEAYRQKLYCSIPLAPFEGDLMQGDTLRFVANTYEDGNVSYSWPIE